MTKRNRLIFFPPLDRNRAPTSPLLPLLQVGPYPKSHGFCRGVPVQIGIFGLGREEAKVNQSSPVRPWSLMVWAAVLERLESHGAFGKPQGTVARVHGGQVIMSVRAKAQNKEHVDLRLCAEPSSSSWAQKIHISKKYGFTKFNACDLMT
ncbi:60S ribosomal protein L10 [Lates japonicus]|uniref:60S ribosomal protein L10 n=1 Tax=Lates japonicus TaxID=270547 RepID=A0AAD3R6D0_LATJO|nr:60S ribosomal protein L10 [Lates japonicus]